LHKPILKHIKNHINILGLIFLLGYSLSLTYFWFRAYLSGNYAVDININLYGEAGIELFLIPLCLIVGVYSFINYFLDYLKSIA